MHILFNVISWTEFFCCLVSCIWSRVLEKEMATLSSVLAWRISGMGEPGGLLSMGSHRVGHDWSNLAAAAAAWTVARQALLSVGFSGQEYWSRLPFPSPGIFPYAWKISQENEDLKTWPEQQTSKLVRQRNNKFVKKRQDREIWVRDRKKWRSN